MNNIFKIDLPPYAYLVQVLNNQPKSASTYIELWRQRDAKNKISVDKQEVRDKFLIAPTRFRNDLYNLVREGLINVEESWDKERKSWHKIDIEIVDYNYEG